MSDLSAGVDHGLSFSSSSSSSAAVASSSASVTRILQHAILQLCNEHVAYDHTLQVLGVVCVTIDDRQQELVVKLNNTLKRVDAVATQSDDRRGTAVRTSSSSRLMSSSPRCQRSAAAAGSEAVSSCSGSSAQNQGSSADAADLSHQERVVDGAANDDMETQSVRASSTATPGLDDGGATTPGVGSESGGRRRCHGRKQSKPVRVQHIIEEVVDSDDDGDVVSEIGSGVVVITPADLSSPHSGANSPMSSRASCSERSSPITPLHLAGARNLPSAKHNLSELYGSMLPCRRTPTPSSTSTVRALLTGAFSKDDNHRSAVAASAPSINFGRDKKPVGRATPQPTALGGYGGSNGDGVEMSDGVLNFSRYALDRPSSQTHSSAASDKPATEQHSGTIDVKVKEEYPPMFPNLELLMGAPANGINVVPYDLSRTLAAFGPFIDEAQMAQLMTLARFDPHQLALYSTLAQTANGCSVPNMALPLVNGINSEMAPPEADADGQVQTNGDASEMAEKNRARYTVSSRLNDGLTMHLSRRLPAVRRRERFRPPGHGSSVKVKDIIMYDDSAPVHSQRGSRIEGDFMLDALHVDGKKRRRRTAEDTLTPEEIAEYMGSTTSATGDGPNTGAGHFACRYCGEMNVDLSRYFAHTLASHGAYVCHQCGKSFTTKSSLLRHRPIHTGMRRFACSICRKSFYRKDKCKAHIKRHLGLPDGGNGGTAGSNQHRPGVATPTIDPQMFAASQLNFAV